jgi:glutamyl-tRNA reductase
MKKIFYYKPPTIDHKLILIGTNHKYSPIELREELSFSKKRIKSALNLLKENSRLYAGLILSTCNRVEIYAHAENEQKGINEIIDFISFYHEIKKEKFLSYFYIYSGIDVIKHLFEVISGLDSLIIGETQILGQVKQAFLEAKEIGFTDKFLDEIFYQALSFASKIHKKTKISEGKISVGSVAIDFIKQKLGNLSDKNILIIGVGKVSELLLKYLKKEKPNVVFISNRTFEKAKDLANEIKASAVKFDELNKFLPIADVIITATSSPHFIIKKETFQKPLAISHKLIFLDLAVPRDVEPQVKEIKNIELYCLEDLNEIIEKNRKKKLKEAEKIKFLIDKEVQKLWSTELEPEKVLLP